MARMWWGMPASAAPASLACRRPRAVSGGSKWKSGWVAAAHASASLVSSTRSACRRSHTWEPWEVAGEPGAAAAEPAVAEEAVEAPTVASCEQSWGRGYRLRQQGAQAGQQAQAHHILHKTWEPQGVCRRRLAKQQVVARNTNTNEKNRRTCSTLVMRGRQARGHMTRSSHITTCIQIQNIARAGQASTCAQLKPAPLRGTTHSHFSSGFRSYALF